MELTGGERGGRSATAAAVVKAWMKSPRHRSNILNCSLEHMGVGYVTF
ncbi:CAP domain-containing protein [Streptomyces collinus]